MDFDLELDALYQSRIPIAPTPPTTTSTSEPNKHSEDTPTGSENPPDTTIHVEELNSTKPKAKYDPGKDPRIHRTLFVGNVTIAAAKKPTLTSFKKLFTPFGEVECIRFRSIPFQEGMPGKWAKQARSYHTKRESMHAYVVMRDEEQAHRATRELNGTVFENLHLRVDAATPTKINAKRSVFVGGLDYHISEEQLWKKFAIEAGEVQSVRLIRESKTGMGKGIAYVQFKEKESAKKALQLSGTSLENKVLRVQPFKKNMDAVPRRSPGVPKELSKLPRRREKSRVPRANDNKKSSGKTFNPPRKSKPFENKKKKIEFSKKSQKPSKGPPQRKEIKKK